MGFNWNYKNLAVIGGQPITAVRRNSYICLAFSWFSRKTFILPIVHSPLESQLTPGCKPLYEPFKNTIYEKTFIFIYLTILK